jgi:hypothetical protein
MKAYWFWNRRDDGVTNNFLERSQLDHLNEIHPHFSGLRWHSNGGPIGIQDGGLIDNWMA